MKISRCLSLFLFCVVTGLGFAAQAHATAAILGECYYDLDTISIATTGDLTISWDNPTLSGLIVDYETGSSASFSGYGFDHDLSYTLPGSTAHVWADVDQMGVAFSADSTGGNTLSGGRYDVTYNQGFTVASGSGTLSFSMHASKLFDLSTDYAGEEAGNGDFPTYVRLQLLQGDGTLKIVGESIISPGVVGVSDGVEYNSIFNDNLIFSCALKAGDVGSLLLYLDNDHVTAVGVTPTPVPASLLLLGSGFIGLIGVRRKRKDRL